MDIFSESKVDRMEEFLDYSSKRQKVINSNIANIETPGYKARDLQFESLFKEYLERELPLRKTQAGHVDGKPVLLRDDVRPQEIVSEALGNDLNNVDLDQEMTKLAENVLKFSAVVQMMQFRLQTVRSSIQGN